MTGMPRPIWMPRLALATSVLGCALFLQGCDVPTHLMPEWRKQPDYMVDFQFVIPGERNPFLNSCSVNGLVAAMQCSGRGTCQPFDNKDPYSVTFCKCSSSWADPECRTKRKSQLLTFYLSMFGGFIGLDRMYVGQWGVAVAKTLTLGGGGFWYVWDIINYGCGTPYATVKRHSNYVEDSETTFRLADDLPRWCFITSTMVWFYAMGFTFSLLSVQKHIRVKRREFMLIQQLEQRMPGLTALAHDTWMRCNQPLSKLPGENRGKQLLREADHQAEAGMKHLWQRYGPGRPGPPQAGPHAAPPNFAPHTASWGAGSGYDGANGLGMGPGGPPIIQGDPWASMQGPHGGGGYGATGHGEVAPGANPFQTRV